MKFQYSMLSTHNLITGKNINIIGAHMWYLWQTMLGSVLEFYYKMTSYFKHLKWLEQHFKKSIFYIIEGEKVQIHGFLNHFSKKWDENLLKNVNKNSYFAMKVYPHRSNSLNISLKTLCTSSQFFDLHGNVKIYDLKVSSYVRRKYTKQE